MMTHKELAKHFRNRLRHEGIKARCDMMVSCGSKALRVFVPAFDATFSEDEQRVIRTIAKANGLTLVRGMEIDIERMTDPQSMHFYMVS